MVADLRLLCILSSRNKYIDEPGKVEGKFIPFIIVIKILICFSIHSLKSLQFHWNFICLGFKYLNIWLLLVLAEEHILAATSWQLLDVLKKTKTPECLDPALFQDILGKNGNWQWTFHFMWQPPLFSGMPQNDTMCGHFRLQKKQKQLPGNSCQNELCCYHTFRCFLFFF